MDNASPSPPKRPRTIDFLTSQLSKPVRYFPFNSNSSGIVEQESKSGRMERVQTSKSQNVITGPLPVIPFSSTMKFVPNKEANISNKLQKLKLKSPDGRDLGEINVQLLPQKGDGIGGKTIMLQKHSLFGKIDNSSTVSILKPVEKSKQVTINGPISIVQSTGNILHSGSNYLNTIRALNNGRETGAQKPVLHMKRKDTQHSPLILRHSDIPKYSTNSLGSKVYLFNVDKQTGLNTIKTVNNEQKIIVVHAENYPDSTEGKKNNVLGTGSELRIASSSKEDAVAEMASSTSNARSIPSVFWNPSKFPDLTSKLAYQKSKGNEIEIGRSGGSMVNDKSMIIVSQSPDSQPVRIANKSRLSVANILQKRQKPKLTSWTIVKTSGKKFTNGRKRSCESDGTESPMNNTDVARISQQAQYITLNNSNAENTQNVTSTTNNILNPVDGRKSDENILVTTHGKSLEEKSSNDQKLRENIMVIVHGDMNTIKNSEKNSTEQDDLNNKTISMEVDESPEKNTSNVTRDGNADLRNSARPDKSRKRENVIKTPGTVPPKQPDLEIIQKALSSCTDQELRNKALKALADCGIGVKRDVPVPPKLSVRNSQTQTQVFSLLKPDTLVECTDDSPTLNSLNIVNANEKSLLHPNNLQLPGDLQSMNGSNDYDFSYPDLLSPGDISTVLAELLPDDSRKDVIQVEGIFSKPNPVVSQAFTQIQKDFQAATTADADGMMGIHRAVLSGNIKEVQRQLIVLKAVKESIEIPNGDERTSLELAVLHDVDRRIVNILLAAGGKPAFPTKLRESALIIACKNSSAALPDLIKHVTPTSLLDLTDSEGFAPLHYCAQVGNMEGVKSLVDAGALINLRDAKSGRTALFHALESRNYEMAWYLLDNGASPNIMNFAGQSPAALVDEHRHNSLVEKFNAAVR